VFWQVYLIAGNGYGGGFSTEKTCSKYSCTGAGRWPVAPPKVLILFPILEPREVCSSRSRLNQRLAMRKKAVAATIATRRGGPNMMDIWGSKHT